MNTINICTPISVHLQISLYFQKYLLNYFDFFSFLTFYEGNKKTYDKSIEKMINQNEFETIIYSTQTHTKKKTK